MSPRRSHPTGRQESDHRNIPVTSTRSLGYGSTPSAGPPNGSGPFMDFAAVREAPSAFHSHHAQSSAQPLQSFGPQEHGPPLYRSSTLPPPGPVPEHWPTMEIPVSGHRSMGSVSSMTQPSPVDHWFREGKGKGRASPEAYLWNDETPPRNSFDSTREDYVHRSSPGGSKAGSKSHPQRRPSNRDEFDGPHQLLDRQYQQMPSPKEQDLPQLSTNLLVSEQDQVLNDVNECLARCAFDFVARYQFPIPLEPDKRPVKTPSDREWTEWVYLLKRLATKRRIPARVLYNGQIKQFVTVLENSMEMRHAAKHQSRPLKDDRNVLQLISAGLQVAKILKDPQAMAYLDHLYAETEARIHSRIPLAGYMP